MTTRVVIHIDRLVLRGFGDADRHAIAAGLRDELARRLAEPGAVHGLAERGAVARLTADAGALPADASPARTGATLGAAVAGALGALGAGGAADA